MTSRRGLTNSARERRLKTLATKRQQSPIIIAIVPHAQLLYDSNVTVHRLQTTRHNCSTYELQRCNGVGEQVCQRTRQTCERRFAAQALPPCVADKPSSNLLKQLVFDLHYPAFVLTAVVKFNFCAVIVSRYDLLCI